MNSGRIDSLVKSPGLVRFRNFWLCVSFLFPLLCCACVCAVFGCRACSTPSPEHEESTATFVSVGAITWDTDHYSVDAGAGLG